MLTITDLEFVLGASERLLQFGELLVSIVQVALGQEILGMRLLIARAKEGGRERSLHQPFAAMRARIGPAMSAMRSFLIHLSMSIRVTVSKHGR